MKKIIILLSALSVLLCSCSKDESQRIYDKINHTDWIYYMNEYDYNVLSFNNGNCILTVYDYSDGSSIHKGTYTVNSDGVVEFHSFVDRSAEDSQWHRAYRTAEIEDENRLIVRVSHLGSAWLPMYYTKM